MVLIKLILPLENVSRCFDNWMQSRYITPPLFHSTADAPLDGIGEALAFSFHRHGCKVIATARSAAKMGRLAEAGITTMEMDTTSDESVNVAAQKLVDDGIKINILVNNAGIICNGPLVETSMDTAQKVINTNTIGTFRVTKALVPSMIETRDGLVLNVSSVVGRIPLPVSLN